MAEDEAVAAILHEITADSVNDLGTIFLRSDLGEPGYEWHWVRNDPRRMAVNGGYGNITYHSRDRPAFNSTDATLADQIGVEQAAFNFWEAANCSNLVLQNHPPADPSVPGLFETGQGGGIPAGSIDPNGHADIKVMGFRSGADWSAFGRPSNVLGFAVFYFWRTPGVGWTDIDNNGKRDVALVEVYMNDGFNWRDDGQSGRIDGVRYIEYNLVAEHEVGHALMNDHFGSTGRHPATNEPFAVPENVMNPLYTNAFATSERPLKGRDKAVHCYNWASW
jgi:hypothetical protein